MKNKTFLKLLPLIFVIFLVAGCTTSKKKKCDTCPTWGSVSFDKSNDFRVLV